MVPELTQESCLSNLVSVAWASLGTVRAVLQCLKLQLRATVTSDAQCDNRVPRHPKADDMLCACRVGVNNVRVA